ncbi:hypothetical protein ACJJI4_15175 [Microbulbifer sp. TRSA002]|uniref:hypothetical protein n=1 Tax=Microbulbifer sp. TRSA002 TaxID=3243382 RepID=UPI0040397C97
MNFLIDTIATFKKIILYLSPKEIIKPIFLKGLSAIATFLFGLSIARLGNISDSGKFFYLVAIVCFLGTVIRLGLDHYIVRTVNSLFHDENRDGISSIYTNGLVVLFFLFSPVMLISYFYSKEIAYTSNSILALLISLYALVYFHSVFFQAIGRLVWHQIFQGVGATLLFLVISVALHLTIGNIDFVSFLQVYIASYISILISAFIIWSRTGYGIKICTFSFSQIFSILKGMILWLSPMLMFIIFSWFGQIMLGFFSSKTEVAFYSISLQVSLLVYLIPMAVNAYVMPNYLKYLNEGSYLGLQNFFFSAVLVSVICTLPIAVFILVFPEFVLMIFGAGYSDAAMMVRVLVFGQVLNIIGSSSFGLLTMLGSYRAVTIVSLLSVSFMLLFVLFNLSNLNGLRTSLAYSLGLAISSFASFYFVFMFFIKAKNKQFLSVVD